MPSPKLKVFNPQGEYIASCKHFEDAATLAGNYGDGAQIRHGHSLVIWREGREEFSAAESVDTAREIMRERIHAAHRAALVKSYGETQVAAWEAGRQ